jgi:hypothetical protein
MVALKLKQFGGMIPAVDPRLLPENQAELSENVWAYSGALEGFRQLKPVHTLVDANTTRVFRIPLASFGRDNIPDSYWMEFADRETDVIASPVNDDSFDRFYWVSPSVSPTYNTKARIIAGNTGPNAPFLLGIPRPTAAPRVSRINSTYYFDCDPIGYNVAGGKSYLYETVSYNVDRGTFFTGELQLPNFGEFGATRPLLTSGSVTTNIDKSAAVASDTPVNEYESTGYAAEMRYTGGGAGNRLTISDDGRLTIGVPPSLQSKPDYTGVGVLEARAYVYTWVSAYGEEGPPSPAALNTGWSGDPWYITITAPAAAEALNRNITKTRIYRTVTGSGGSTTYFLVEEVPIASTAYTDVKKNDVVATNSILESYFWDAPPSSLKGMSTMPNGIVAGFKSNEVWFSEPYRPHAWPAPYMLSFDADIVGLGVTGQTLIVLTTSAPYAVTGINPSQMAVSRLKRVEPCTSKGSIVSMSTGVMYCSTSGLVLATPGDLSVVTNNIVTKDRWEEFVNIDTLRGVQLGGAYYGWGTIKIGCFYDEAFEPDAFSNNDFSGAYTGVFLDFSNERIGFNTLFTTTETVNTITDIWTGEVLIIRNGVVNWLDLSFTRPYAAYKWKSKIFEMPNGRNLEAMRIWFKTYSTTPALNPVPVINPTTLAADMYGIVRVYADDRLVYSREIRTSGELFRLPSGFKATWWQVEIESRVQIHNIETATAAKELASV